MERKIRLVHLLGDLLNLYGDGGNIRVLQQRCAWRGIELELVTLNKHDEIKLDQADIVFLGGAADREQRLASEVLLAARTELQDFVENNGVLLAICGGFQMLGHTWVLDGQSVAGLGILDVETRRIEGAQRIINNIVLRSDLATHPVVGYENHMGRTYLGDGVKPFGSVINKEAFGNNDDDGTDGARYKNVLATYLHGPLLSKNPEIADWIITQALIHAGEPQDLKLAPLDDSLELAANTHMAQRLGVQA